MLQQWPEGIKARNLDLEIPLHMACGGQAPLQVVETLLQRWPNSIKAKNHEDFLPLHAACGKNAPLEVAKALTKRFPDAVKAKTSHGDLPLHLAVWTQSPIPVILYLLSQWRPYAVRVKHSEGMTPLKCARTPKENKVPNAMVVAMLETLLAKDEANPFPV